MSFSWALPRMSGPRGRRRRGSRYVRLKAVLGRADRRGFEWVARSRVPVVGPGLRPLSRLADHSKLWLAISCVLLRADDPRARRGALRGLGCVVVSSAVVNGGVKRAFARARPAVGHVPPGRLARRLPRSGSLPSGHTASAFAFAAGVAVECPGAAAAGLVGMAAAVGFSRTYIGVHYPGDVLAGAAIGVGIAGASTVVWRSPPTVTRPGAGQGRVVDAPATGNGKGLVLVVNPDGGSGLDPAELQRRLPAARITALRPGDDLVEVRRRAAGGAQILGVAGGDGSANGGAAVARETGLPLLLLPGGTLNHLCRDLGLPSVEDALEALASGSATSMDVGVIGDRVFLNTASVGSYPELVVARERLEPRIGKWPAALIAGARAVANAEPSELEIDGRPARIWTIFIGNCRYEPPGPAPCGRSRLDDGRLDVRMLDAERPFARLRLIAAVLSGRGASSTVLKSFHARTLSLRSTAGPVRVSRDGEVDPELITGATVEKAPAAVVIYCRDQRCAR